MDTPNACLRDLRRYAARHGAPLHAQNGDGSGRLYAATSLFAARPWWKGGALIARVPHELVPIPTEYYRRELTIAELDRLIGVLGPDWRGADDATGTREGEARQEGEAREKGHNEVASAGSQSDGALHGGDGNAGEVDSLAQTASQEARKEQGGANEKSLSHAPAPQPDAVEADGNTPRTSELGTRSNGCDCGAGNTIASRDADDAGDRMWTEDDLAAADAPDRDDRDVAGAAEETADPPNGDDHGETEGHDESSPPEPTSPPGEVELAGAIRVPIRSHGGDTAAEWDEVITLSKAARKDARDVERALRRLIRAVDMGGLDDSPRLDARRLTRELVSRRYALSRAVRRETTLPIVVLAADVSGSCAACSDETLAAALAVADELEHVIVVRHSNGWVVDVVGSAARDVKLDARTRLAELVFSIRRPVACVIAWGDADAAGCYRALCEASARFYWLDSYAAKKSGPRPASKRLRHVAHRWRRQPDAWWQGVNDAARTATALRAMERLTKSG